MGSSKGRILCGESNKDISHLLCWLLERQGYEVESAHTTADCLQVASTEYFDLYLINDEYPDGDGLEMCQQLRGLSPGTPILLYSLDRTGYDRQAAKDAGADMYLTKIEDFAELIRTIDSLLSSPSS